MNTITPSQGIATHIAPLIKRVERDEKKERSKNDTQEHFPGEEQKAEFLAEDSNLVASKSMSAEVHRLDITA